MGKMLSNTRVKTFSDNNINPSLSKVFSVTRLPNGVGYHPLAFRFKAPDSYHFGTRAEI